MRVRVSPWITMFILLGIAGGFQFASVSEDVSFNIEIPRANPLKEPLTTKHVANPRLYFDISSVTTYAGSGAIGSLNGPAALASFEGPNDVAVDFSGNVYISDGNMIRKINKIGIVTTLAGSNLYGFADGHGANAKFTGPMGIAVDGSGNLYVADAGNHRIRKVTPSGYVSTIAGSGIEGFRDGSGVFAQFYDPRDVAVDHAGNIYVADYQNNRIRKINQEGLVTTFAGDGNVDYDDGPGTTASFYSTQSLAFDPKGNLYVTQVYGRLRKITPAGVVSTVISPGLPNEFHFGVTTDDYSNVYVSLSPAPEEDYIVKLSPGGEAKILAGGARGFQDGQGQNAKFNVSHSITMDDKGNMYVADFLNYRIRKISKPELKFSTTAGNPSPEQLVSISGIGVMGNILVTVPPAYEITQTSGSGYASSLSLTPESGEVNMAQIFVRLKANAGYGFHNGYIQLSSPGAKTQKHPLKGFVADNIPPQVECPSSQIFCFSPSNLYHIPLLNVMDAGGIKKISYTITGATNRSGTGTNASGYFNPGINQLKWVVTDLAGNTSTCTTQVKIDYRLNVVIADSYPLLYLGRANTIYKGLGSGCARLYVIVTGGTPFAGSNKYQYLWSNGSTGSHTTVCPSNVGNHQYTVTVTDALGCKITVTKTIEVVDARCGPNNERFLLCLNGNQVCYSGAQALWAIFHGARPGPCNDPVARISTPGDNKKETETIRAFTGIRVFPNPNKGSFNLQWDVTDAKEMTILDVSGKIIQRRSINGTTGLQTMRIDLGPVPSGLYLVIITGKDRQYTSKIIIQ